MKKKEPDSIPPSTNGSIARTSMITPKAEETAPKTANIAQATTGTVQAEKISQITTHTSQTTMDTHQSVGASPSTTTSIAKTNGATTYVTHDAIKEMLAPIHKRQSYYRNIVLRPAIENHHLVSA